MEREWVTNLKQTWVVGKTHPDTFFCDDIELLKRDFQTTPQISQIDIYTDN